MKDDRRARSLLKLLDEFPPGLALMKMDARPRCSGGGQARPYWSADYYSDGSGKEDPFTSLAEGENLIKVLREARAKFSRGRLR